MKALIIDDSRTMRRLLASYVSEFAIEVVEAGDGLEGLEQLQRHPATDLTLVDWDMPRMNGLEFVRAVRSDRAFADMKVMMVFMTAFGGLAKRRTNTHAAHWSHQAATRPRA